MICHFKTLTFKIKTKTMFNNTIVKISNFIAKYGMYTIWCIVALFVYTFVISNIYYNKGWDRAVESIQKDGTEVKTNTIIKHDTVAYSKPVPYYITKTKTKTDTLLYTKIDTVKQTAVVEIPIERKEYADSNYYCAISGYHPILDTIAIFKQDKVITNTITRTIKKTPLITVQPQIGYGFGLNSRQFEPSVGISIGMPIFTIYRKN